MGPLNSTTAAGPDRTISAEVERLECIARRVTELGASIAAARPAAWSAANAYEGADAAAGNRLTGTW